MEKTTLATSQTKRSSPPSSSTEDFNRRTKQRVSDDKASVREKSVEEGDDDEGVEEKIEALQTIVPGGTKLDDVDELFEETASYILALQSQINAIRDATDSLERFEDENDMKFGA